ncbi:unnamed protein product [Rotaria sp. Silwood1]|nr:unnamed protein product [Rotaria sp. Silwood1]
MTDNKVIDDSNIRELGAKWVFQELWHSSALPSDAMHLEYTQALINLAGADGVLADKERQWILGNAVAKGASADVINHFTTYQPTKADIEAMIASKPTFTQHAGRSLIFEAILAASADIDLHAAERNAIYRLGQSMGMDEALLQEIEQAAVNEISHRRQIVALMYPEGLHKSLNESETDFKSEQT